MDIPKLVRNAFLVGLVGLLGLWPAQSRAAKVCTPELATLELITEQELPYVDLTCTNYPFLNVRWVYECTRCGEPRGTFEFQNTAHGACEASVGAFCQGQYAGELEDPPNRASMMLRHRALVYGDWTCFTLFFETPSATCYCPAPRDCGATPLVVSLFDNKIELTGVECGVEFDLDGDEAAEVLSWTRAGSDEGFLFLDRNDNGAVDNGAELFGNYTPQPSVEDRNGFRALAVFDDLFNGGNEDGVINREDRIYELLQLWIDGNHNGVSDSGEIFRISEVGIEEIDLEYRETSRVDQYGNQYKFWSFAFGGTDGQQGGDSRWQMWDVAFVLGTSPVSPFSGACSEN